jgi:hypothetical protein
MVRTITAVVLMGVLVAGCSTTHIKDVTVIKQYKNGKLICHTVIKKRAGTANVFTDKKFDTITAKAGDTSVTGKMYTSTVNAESIEKTGGAVGTIAGKAIQAAATM